jgi:hypothetical protein
MPNAISNNLKVIIERLAPIAIPGAAQYARRY